MKKSERVRIGREFAAETPKGDFIRWTGRSRPVIERLGALFEFPFPNAGAVDTPAFIRWVFKFLVENERKIHPKGPSKNSGQLFDDEERLLKAKADLEELKRDEKLGELVRRDQVQDVLMQWAGVLKKTGDSLGKKFGPEAQELLVDALEDCEALVEEM